MAVIPAFSGGNNAERKKSVVPTLILKLDEENGVLRMEMARRQQEGARKTVPRGFVNRGDGNFFRFPPRYRHYQVIYPLTIAELDGALETALREDKENSEMT